MNTKRILSFLNDVARNNNREWFAEHKDEYLQCKEDFERGIDLLIERIAEFDPSIAHLTAKDCVYRFYRDIRFSPDKSPYKRHFCAYICAKGKKSLYGGYYIHVQPGKCMVSLGTYMLPTNILNAVRNEIMGNIDEWRERVENPRFVDLFGIPGGGVWEETGDATTSKGFGLTMLKKAPKDFPADYEFMPYLRLKDYAVWHKVSDSFLGTEDWEHAVCNILKVGKPMMDFVNAVVEDYID